MDVSVPLSLPETVYRQLRSALLRGVFRPNQMLRQEELARQFGVSRAPLREALPRLEAEGLVVLRPRRGYAVASLDIEEIQEIFELRTLIEERGGYLATLRRTEEDVVRLRNLVAQMEALHLADSAEVDCWLDLNFQFHDTLLAPCRRKHFRRVATSLRVVVEPYLRIEVALSGDVAEAQREHRELLDAFAAGDAVRVARITRDHSDHTARRLIDTFEKNQHQRSGVGVKDLPLSLVPVATENLIRG